MKVIGGKYYQARIPAIASFEDKEEIIIGRPATTLNPVHLIEAALFGFSEEQLGEHIRRQVHVLPDGMEVDIEPGVYPEGSVGITTDEGMTYECDILWIEGGPYETAN